MFLISICSLLWLCYVWLGGSKYEVWKIGTTNEVETRYSQKWDEMDILEKTIENRKGHDDFVFYDGPATANGMPGIHHMLAKLLKDKNLSDEEVLNIRIRYFVNGEKEDDIFKKYKHLYSKSGFNKILFG